MKWALALLLAFPLHAGAIRLGATGDRAVTLLSAPGVTITATPFARTVTCTGAITLTGTAPGAGAVSWAASPDGASGACTGTGSWSCAVSVSPNAAGEGVETITITQAGVGGSSRSVDVGFYVAGAHSCFLAQSYDGAYNSGKADLAAVGTWVNLGSSALNVTQPTGSAQPTYRTNIVNGQPVVRFDGGDWVFAATAADWTFLHNTAVESSLEATWRVTSVNPAARSVVVATRNNCTTSSTAIRGACHYAEDVSFNDAATLAIVSGTAGFIETAANDAPSGRFNLTASTNAAVNIGLRVNGGTVETLATPTASALDPSGGLAIGGETDLGLPLIGDVFDVLIYSTALTSTQQDINEAVREWALGGALPLIAQSNGPPDQNRWVFVGDSITEGCCGATSWVSKITEPVGVTLVNVAVSGALPNDILGQFRANATGVGQVAGKVFILGGINTIRPGGTATTAFTSLQIIYDEATAQGSDVVALTLMPFENNWTGAKQVQLDALNALIDAPARGVDVVIDLFGPMGQPGFPNNINPPFNSGDGLHPSDAGTAEIARLVDVALGLS